MSSKIITGISVIAAVLMVAGTLTSGMFNAYALDFDKVTLVGNIAAAKQTNSANGAVVGVSGAAAAASVGGTGGAGGGVVVAGPFGVPIPIPGGPGGPGGAGGTVLAYSGPAYGELKQKNYAEATQTTTVDCDCLKTHSFGSSFTAVGNIALAKQSNSADGAIVGVSGTADAASVGGNGGAGGILGAAGGAGGAGGDATAYSGSANGYLYQDNDARATQTTTLN